MGGEGKKACTKICAISGMHQLSLQPAPTAAVPYDVARKVTYPLGNGKRRGTLTCVCLREDADEMFPEPPVWVCVCVCAPLCPCSGENRLGDSPPRNAFSLYCVLHGIPHYLWCSSTCFPTKTGAVSAVLNVVTPLGLD